VQEIAACLDGSELGSGIVPHAHALARAFGARLTLLHVLETESAEAAPRDALDWGIRRREARTHLERVEAEIGEVESGCRSELIQGRAAEQICSWAAQHEVDLMVLCSHGIHGVTDWDLASTARKLIDRAPGSLLVVPAAVAAKGGARYRRILVPLDGSTRSESVIPLAMRIARSEQAEILLVHIVPVPEFTRTGPLDAEGAELERRMVAYNQRSASGYLDRLRARVGQEGVRVRARVVSDGHVPTRLQQLVRQEGVDLLVLSAHGHSGRTDLPCGSVAEHAVTHATIPTLMVRDPMPRRMHRVAPQGVRARESLPSRSSTTL
jgi:nucleotide-binding universal stress UspA family protein